MRKQIIEHPQSDASLHSDEWLQLEDLAEVEVTSEDAAHPIESALLPNRGTGWRAAAPGKQIIRLIFTRPQQLRRIQLSFLEAAPLMCAGITCYNALRHRYVSDTS